MRIHRLRLAHYRGIVEREVTFATTGVTVIEGPNEIGKSSMAEAMALVLEELDSSTKERVRAVRPVGRDEGTEVEVDLSTGPYRFTLRKRWFKGKGTWLDIQEPRREQLTGREAHERVQAMIAETADLALWEALRLEQGREAGPGALATRSVLKALDAVAGGTADGEEGDLWERIAAEWSKYFTPTGQARAERKHLEAAAAEHEAELARLDAELAELSTRIERVAAIDNQLDRIDRDVTAAVQQRDELDAAWRELEVTVRAVRDLDVARERAAVRHERAEGAVRQRRALVADLDAALARLESLATSDLAVAGDGEEHARRSAEAEAAVAAARSALDAAEVVAAAAEDTREAARWVLDHALLSERYERVQEVSHTLAELAGVLEHPIEAAEVDAIEDAVMAVASARAVLEAGAGTITIEAVAPVAGTEGGAGFTVAAGAASTRAVTDAVVVDLPGVARIEVVPGPGVRDGAAQLAAAEAELARRCAAIGATDGRDARSLLRAYEDACRSRDDLVARRRQDLRDLTVEEMGSRIETLAERIAAAEARRGGAALPSHDDADVAAREAGAAVEAARTELSRAERAAEALRQMAQHHLAETTRHQVLRETAANAVAAAEAALAAARAATSDEVLDAELAEAGAAVAEAAARYDAAAAELAAHDPESVEVRLANARAKVDRLTGDRLELEQERSHHLAYLQAKGDDSLHQKRSDASSSLEHAQLALERDRRRAAAADLLHRSFAARREAARQRYVAPFRARLERFGRIVYGPTFEVELDHELRVVRRTLDGVTLDVRQLSVGAREQLAVLSRLAGAAIVSTDGGAPVIFDDTLGWTDPERLAGMGAAIASAGRDCQVIILSCVPDRFAGVGNATTVRLLADMAGA